MVSITVDDVQDVYGNKAPSFGSTQQEALKDIAERLTEQKFSGRISRQSIIETAEDDFAAFLGAHLWEIAEGGEAQSQSQTGGSVNYGHLQGNIEQSLSETRYGRVCQLMTDDQSSNGIVRADR